MSIFHSKKIVGSPHFLQIPAASQSMPRLFAPTRVNNTGKETKTFRHPV